MKFIKKSIVLIALLIFCADNLLANNYSYINYLPEKGLQDRRTFSCVKDNKGYIWIATRTSVDRFDGYSFKHYELPYLDLNERLRGVVCSPDSTNLLAFTNKNVYIYNNSIDSFELFSTAIKLSNSEVIRNIYYDLNANTYLLTNEGIYIICGNRFIRLKGSENLQVFDIIFLTNNRIFIGSDKGVFDGHIKDESIKFKQITKIPSVRIQSLYIDPTLQRVWIGSFSSGTYIYNIIQSTVEKIKAPFTNVPVREIVAVSDNRIWVATDGLSILEYDRIDCQFIGKIGSGNQINDMVPNNIYHILNDGNIVWVSTYSNGLMARRIQSIVEQVYRVKTSDGISLVENHFNAILEDNNKNLWFATNGGVFRYDNQSKTTKAIYKSTGQSNAYLSLFEDSNGSIWAGGYSTKILKISPTSLNTEEISIIDGKNDYHIYAINEDLNGNLFFGSAIDSLIIYNPLSREATLSLPKGIYSLLQQNDGSMISAGINGLHHINSTNKKVEYIDLKNSSLGRNPFIYNMIASKTHNSCIWFTTDGQGLCLFDLESREISSWDNKNGLSSNFLYGLAFDHSGNLWISSENGLNCFNTTTNQVVSIHENSGLPSQSFNFAAFAERKNGNILFGTPSEAIEISPLKKLSDKRVDANLRFTDFTLYNNGLQSSGQGTPLHIPIDDVESVTLNHTQNSFSIEFSNLSQIYGDMLLYRWRLMNADNEWTTSLLQHRAMYSNLQSGRYRFIVEVATQESNKVLQSREFEIIIKPPLYATWWAILIYLIVGGVILYLSYKYYLNKLETRRSDEKIRFFINVAHDIRTPITLIKAPLNEIEQEELSQSGKGALNLALSSVEKLLNRVSQLLDFQKLEYNAMHLKTELTDINSFMLTSIQPFNMSAKHKNINLALTLPSEKLDGWIDQQKVNLILENLLSNALKYSEQGGNIAVRLSSDPKVIQIEVIDDGIGIPSSAQANIFSKFYRAENATNSKEIGSGIGLLFVKKLIALHKGTISFVSNPKCGTIFIVKLPYREDQYSAGEKFINSAKLQSITSTRDTNTQYSVLIVEDNDELRVYLGNYLRKNYNVFEAENGKKALEIAHQNEIDLIISDVMMPVMDGFELCKSIKDEVETSHIPVILLTSLTEREDIIKGISGGAEDYISKPFDLIILETKIENIIKRRVKLKHDFIDNSTQDLRDESYDKLTASDKSFLEKLYSLIEERMSDEDYAVEKMAYDMAMSYSVFYRKIKTLLGINPKELVVDIKMKRATELIKEQSYSITEIAYLIGFSNAKYFSTAFKKHYGVSPTSYNSDKKTI